MDVNLEKDVSAFGGLFLTVMADLRGSAPIWEDFTSKATKLHTTLKTTLVAITAFLDAFQKVADMATGSRGATKEIGSALTRLCLRHRTIELKLKKFTGTILDSLVTPLQECMEDWKKTVVQLDKEHAKEYKKAKQEIKKCAADTVRLQKKMKKGHSFSTSGKADMQGRLESSMQDVNDKYILLEEQEKSAVRGVLIEERGRFCHFVSCVKPFVDEEVGLLTEVTHLQEIMDSLCLQADNPQTLPLSSEQVIMDLKGLETGSWSFQTPPSSPSSLGSRKSSMCSISSIASSSSGSVQSHSPCHKNLQQQQAMLLGSGVRLTSVSSQDSGFTSQDTLFLRPTTPSSLNIHMQSCDNISHDKDTPEMDSTPSTPQEMYPNTSSATSTWTNWPNPPVVSNTKTETGRPHTISSAYEKTSQYSRPPLTSQMFEPPKPGTLDRSTSVEGSVQHDPAVLKRDRPHSTISMPYSRPQASINKMQSVLPPLGPKPKSRAVAPPKVPVIGEQPMYEQPVYANLSELQELQGGGATDTGDPDLTPTTPTTRDPPTVNMGNGKREDGLDLTEAIADLDHFTAALHGDFSPGDRKSKIKKNTLELAAAIKELEASTAALEMDTQASQSSLQCSSGYGTMNSTPAGSENTIASGDYVDTGQLRDIFPTDHDIYPPEHEKYFTMPRNSQLANMYKAALQFKRPASTAGIPLSAQGGHQIGGVGVLGRRSSMNNPKPPPPVRRSSSISAAPNSQVLNKFRNSPPRQLNTKPQPAVPGQVTSNSIKRNAQQQQAMAQAQGNHRRTNSASGSSEPAYAELTEIQQSIAARQQGQRSSHGNPAGGQGYMSSPVTPQYAQPVTNPSHTVGSTNVVNSLNTKFGVGQSQIHNTSQSISANTQNNTNTHSTGYQSNCNKLQAGPVVKAPSMAVPVDVAPSTGPDFPDLPPPPTDNELKEIEQIYGVPKQIKQQSQLHTQSQTQNNLVQMRNPQNQHVHNTQQVTQQPPTVGGIDMRQSLISEMKAGNKFRKFSASEEGSEC